jgi:UDP-N-acetyl-D-mannosaminuronic acid dehydrogenase
VQQDKSPDMSYVESATRSVARVLKEGDLVILESTSPVGTTEWLVGIIASERPDLVSSSGSVHDLKISIAYCPERILPGRMVSELVKNDRIVGGVTPNCAARAKALYSIFVRGEIFETSSAAAELVKLIENAYRDVNIAFANEVANLCDQMKLNAWDTIALANKHPRVNILNPGPGVGGHCIAVDPWFLIAQHPAVTPLMRAARNVNDGRPHTAIEKVEQAVIDSGSVKICCLGLAYKPDVDDLRESPAMEIVQNLALKGRQIMVVEPNISVLPGELADLPNVILAPVQDAIAESDIVVLLVGHMPFKGIGASSLDGKVVIDCVGLWKGSRAN